MKLIIKKIAMLLLYIDPPYCFSFERLTCIIYYSSQKPWVILLLLFTSWILSASFIFFLWLKKFYMAGVKNIDKKNIENTIKR